jgi:hypothetical protein
LLNAPRAAFVSAVRAVDTITASLMIIPQYWVLVFLVYFSGAYLTLRGKKM